MDDMILSIIVAFGFIFALSFLGFIIGETADKINTTKNNIKKKKEENKTIGKQKPK